MVLDKSKLKAKAFGLEVIIETPYALSLILLGIVVLGIILFILAIFCKSSFWIQIILVITGIIMIFLSLGFIFYLIIKHPEYFRSTENKQTTLKPIEQGGSKYYIEIFEEKEPVNSVTQKNMKQLSSEKFN